MSRELAQAIRRYSDNGGQDEDGAEVLGLLCEEGRIAEAIEMLKVIRLDNIEFHLLEIKQALGVEDNAMPVWFSLDRLTKIQENFTDEKTQTRSG